MIEQAQLRTERLLLRPFELADVDDVYAYAADEEWSRYLPAVPYPYERRDAEQFVARCVLSDWQTRVNLALEHEGRVIGSMGLLVSAEHRIAEMGWSIGRAHWGNGLAAEGASAIIDWAFPAFDLVKVFARADARNERSWRLMERLGMTREALLRSHRVVRGERADEVVYGLLRQEWQPRARR